MIPKNINKVFAFYVVFFLLLAVYTMTNTAFCLDKSEFDPVNFLNEYFKSKNDKKIEMVSYVSEISQNNEIPFLEYLINHGDNELKVAAISALGNIPSEINLHAIRKYLSDSNSLIRIVSAKTLLKHGDDTGVKTLVNTLKDEKSDCFEIPFVLETLSLSKSKLSIQSLKDFIVSGRCLKNYEGEALISLGKIGGEEATKFLINYMEHVEKKDINRTYAIRALCYSDQITAIEYLKKINSEKNETVPNMSLVRKIIESKKNSGQICP